jgi:hypothetical protein
MANYASFLTLLAPILADGVRGSCKAGVNDVYPTRKALVHIVGAYGDFSARICL